MGSSFWLIALVLICISFFGCGESEKEDETQPGSVVSAVLEESPEREDVSTQTAAMPSSELKSEEVKKTRREKLSDEAVDELIIEVRKKLAAGERFSGSRGPNPITLLGRSKDSRAVPVLVEVLSTSKVPLARRHAARALGMIDDPEAIEALKPALTDEYIWVRLTAALSLARRGEKDAPLPIFSEIINRELFEDWKIEMSQESAGNLSEEEVERRQKSLRKMRDQTLPLLALSGLDKINTSESIEIVKVALESENPYVKRKAEKILKK